MGITICRGIIFIDDSQNNKIQALIRYGKYIFEIKCKEAKDMSNIVIANDYIYMNDWVNHHLIEFKLIYDYINFFIYYHYKKSSIFFEIEPKYLKPFVVIFFMRNNI
jgi:hypothetical protein